MPVIESQRIIIQKFSEPIIERILIRVRKRLQSLDFTFSGIENSNTWDDICIQVQSELSIYWDQYEEIFEGFISLELEKLPYHEKMSIWLQTESGKKLIEDEIFNFKEKIGLEDLGEIGFNQSETIGFLSSLLWMKADNWSNKRIRDYIG